MVKRLPLCCIKLDTATDSACGSGNFLTETYLRLRALENRVIGRLLHDQGYFELGGDNSLVKVSIDQFYGIEINDFAVAVAKTALWIAEQQALDDTEAIAGQTLPHLPLHDAGNIVCANALRTDWNDVLPAAQCDYVMGNPPFIGQYTKTSSQTDDMKLMWGDEYDGYLDYATGWYIKAAQYLDGNPDRDAMFAFVSTNSITQGQPVPSLFKPLLQDGWYIRFAHRTFAWNAQSSDMAHVHVVIIGMDRQDGGDHWLYEYDDIHGTPERVHAKAINGYLIDGPIVWVEKRSQAKGTMSPLLALANRGSQQTDGGHLILDTRDAYEEAIVDPIAAKYVRPFRMGRELINGIDRWCLWLVDAEPGDIRRSSFLKRRVSECKAYREQVPKSGDAYKNRETPWLFRDNHQPSVNYLAIPRVFSSRREYATCEFYTPDIIAGDKIYVSVDPDGFAFAIIESRMFMAWQKGIGGRLKSDCNFSNTVVWNNLPLPEITDDMRAQIIAAGQRILDVRRHHSGQSLADLYDPYVMPTDLRKAHEALDKLVDRAFGAPRWLGSDDDARLQLLFADYVRLTHTKERR